MNHEDLQKKVCKDAYLKKDYPPEELNHLDSWMWEFTRRNINYIKEWADLSGYPGLKNLKQKNSFDQINSLINFKLRWRINSEDESIKSYSPLVPWNKTPVPIVFRRADGVYYVDNSHKKDYSPNIKTLAIDLSYAKDDPQAKFLMSEIKLKIMKCLTSNQTLSLDYNPNNDFVYDPNNPQFHTENINLEHVKDKNSVNKKLRELKSLIKIKREEYLQANLSSKTNIQDKTPNIKPKSTNNSNRRTDAWGNNLKIWDYKFSGHTWQDTTLKFTSLYVDYRDFRKNIVDSVGSFVEKPSSTIIAHSLSI